MLAAQPLATEIVLQLTVLCYAMLSMAKHSRIGGGLSPPANRRRYSMALPRPLQQIPLVKTDAVIKSIQSLSHRRTAKVFVRRYWLLAGSQHLVAETRLPQWASPAQFSTCPPETLANPCAGGVPRQQRPRVVAWIVRPDACICSQIWHVKGQLSPLLTRHAKRHGCH